MGHVEARPGIAAALILTWGCVSPGLAPPPQETRGLERVVVIAMEAPPLKVPLEFRATVSGSVAGLASPLLVYNTIAVLIEAPAASRRAAEASASLQAALDAGRAWVPTFVAAGQASAQLAARGLEVTVDPGVRPVPGVARRGGTLSMENWLAPIRAWYNDTRPVPRPEAATPGRRTLVLEVGILNYEIMGDDLLLQVMVKLIDPASGAVIGRARAAVAPKAMPHVGPLDAAFAGSADVFKRIVVTQSRMLVHACLVQLGLLD
jgi:hypothetical protein